MQPDSKFAAAYQAGISKLNYWDPVYEDSLNLIAKLPGVAALIYRNTYKGGDLIPHDPNLDWAANLSHQMGTAACRDIPPGCDGPHACHPCMHALSHVLSSSSHSSHPCLEDAALRRPI